MFYLRVFLNKTGEISAFEADGHALGDEKGKDIICAAVSAVICTALLGLTRILSIEGGLEQDPEEGYTFFCLSCALEPLQLEKAQLLLTVMMESIEEISRQYPQNVVVQKKTLSGEPLLLTKIRRDNKKTLGGRNMNNQLQPKKSTEAKISKDKKPYTLEKLLGAAFLGAAAGMLFYYIYNELGDDCKIHVKKTVVDTVKSQVRMALADPEV